jgi:branched-chain amino acid transport system ATP-binding protein
MTAIAERDRIVSASTAAPLLAVRNIEVVYDNVILVLRGLSLDVPKGEIVALLGANGAGKSTTLKAISGLLKTEDGDVTRGEILFDGQRIDGMDPDKIVRRGIFQVMEGRRIIADMTSIENLRLGAFTRRDREIDHDIERVFQYFPRLKERTGLAGYLSGGEQQMLAIGRAMMARPKMILMDEPSMGLSPLLVKEVFGIIRQINRDWCHHSAGRAERARRAVGREPRLHHGARQGGARRHRRRAARQ